MGFLKKLKKVIKKIDPIGSKIADKTNKVVAKVASKDPITRKLMKIDPMMKQNSLGRALRGFNPMAEGLASEVNARIRPQAPPGNTGVVPPQMAGQPQMMGPFRMPRPMGFRQAMGGLEASMGGAPDMGMGGQPPMAPMGAPPMGAPPMNAGGVMPPGMGSPGPMPMQQPMNPRAGMLRNRMGPRY